MSGSDGEGEAPTRRVDPAATRRQGAEGGALPGAIPPEVAAAPAAARFGNFVRVGLIGRGGMGEVWRGWDLGVGRWVALKFLSGGSESELARFQLEASVAGRLDHPNIARVYEIGEAQGRAYIAMQLVEGVTASRLPRGDIRLAVRVIRDAARAVHAAHGEGIVHRDIKPDNLMVADGGSGAGSGAGREGCVYVMDFGLARQTEGASGLSLTGAIIGTPAYMAPEQTRGTRVGPAADIWSLGATLYHLVTGKPPFAGESILDLLRAVQESDPARPRSVNPALDAEIDVVILKCLERDPGERYSTALALADDLDLWLRGEPVSAHPVSMATRLSRALRRRPAYTATAAIAVLAVAAAAAGLVPPLLRARADTRRADRALALWVDVSADMQELRRLARTGNTREAAERFNLAVRRCDLSAGGGDIPEAHYFLGRLYGLVGRHEDAILELDRALAMDPSLGEARLERGIARSRLYLLPFREHQQTLDRMTPVEKQRAQAAFAKSMAAARGLLDLAVADLRTPAGKTSWFQEDDAEFALATLDRAQGRLDDAERRLRVLLARNPGHAEALITLAWLRADQSDWKDAWTLAREAATLDPGNADPLILVCRCLNWRAVASPDDPLTPEWEKDLLEASTEAVRREPRNRAARLWLSAALAKTGAAAQAAVILRQLLDERPDQQAILVDLALAVRDAGDVPGGLALLEKSVRLTPDDYAAWYNLGITRQMMGDVPGSFAAFDTCLGLFPTWPIALNTRGRAQMMQDRHEKAIEDFDAALVSDPTYSMARLNRGLALWELGRHDEAMTEFDKVVTERPRYPQGWWARGELRWKNGDVKGAESDLTRLLELQPDNHQARHFRGLSRCELHDADGAIADLTLLAENGHYVASCRFALGNCFVFRNDLERAIREFTGAIESDPKMVEAWVNRGTAYFQLRKYAESIRDYDQVVVLEPGNYEAIAQRAFAKSFLKDWQGAVDDYTTALAAAPADWAGRARCEAHKKALRKKLKK